MLHKKTLLGAALVIAAVPLLCGAPVFATELPPAKVAPDWYSTASPPSYGRTTQTPIPIFDTWVDPAAPGAFLRLGYWSTDGSGPGSEVPDVEVTVAAETVDTVVVPFAQTSLTSAIGPIVDVYAPDMSDGSPLVRAELTSESTLTLHRPTITESCLNGDPWNFPDVRIVVLTQSFTKYLVELDVSFGDHRYGEMKMKCSQPAATETITSAAPTPTPEPTKSPRPTKTEAPSPTLSPTPAATATQIDEEADGRDMGADAGHDSLSPWVLIIAGLVAAVITGFRVWASATKPKYEHDGKPVRE